MLKQLITQALETIAFYVQTSHQILISNIFYEFFLFCSFCFDLWMYSVSLQDEAMYILYNKSTGNYLKHDGDATSELNLLEPFFISHFSQQHDRHVCKIKDSTRVFIWKEKLTLNWYLWMFTGKDSICVSNWCKIWTLIWYF